MAGQKIDKFYGFQLRASREIEPKIYSEAMVEARNALKSLALDKNQSLFVYVTRLQFFVTRDKVFGIGPLQDRLRQATLRFDINPKERALGRMFFLNDVVPVDKWLRCQSAVARAKKYSIAATLPGDFCQDDGLFEALVFTCVTSDLPDRRRKIKITVSTTPTDVFGRKLRNTDGKFTTELDYALDREVQLLLELGPSGD